MNRLTGYDRWFILLLIIFSAASLYQAGRLGIWFDEAYSVALSGQTIGQLLYFAGQDVHPPGYYLLLKGWASIFGNSELAMRSLSTLSIVLALAVLYHAVRARIGGKTALLVAVVVATAPLTLRYAFELRMYGLVLLIATLATVTLLRLNKRNETAGIWRLIVVYAALIAAGMYVHYYTLFIWIAHGVFVLASGQSDTPRRFRTWLSGVVLAIVLFLPQLPVAYSQFTAADERTSVSSDFSPNDILTSLLNTVTFAREPDNIWLYAVAAIALVLSAAAIILAYRTANQQVRRYLALALLLCAIPLLGGLLIMLPPYRVAYYDRYFLFSLLSLLVAAALACAVLLRDKRYRVFAFTALAVLLIGSSIGVSQVIAYGNRNENYVLRTGVKELMAAVNEKAAPDDVLLLDHPRHFYEVSYYNERGLPLYIYDMHGDTERGGGIAIAASRKDLLMSDVNTLPKGRDRIWYITPRALSVTPIPPSWRQLDEIAHESYIARLYSR